MIRFFAIILTSILLSLSMVPCGDDIQAIASELANKSFQHDESSTDNHDDCSPFCVCNCCKINTFTTDKNVDLDKVNIDQFIKKSFPLLEEHLYNNAILDIWQPPKLS